MAVRYTFAADTAANWAVSTLILAVGQPGWDLTNRILRIGDGASLWSALPTVNAGASNATGASVGLIQLAGDLTGTATAPALASTGVSAGSYTLSSITVDAKGRITAASSGSPSGAADATTGSKGVVQLAGDLAGTAASPTVPALSSKAPLASPAFTGDPTAPTPATADNDTSIATTAFVKAQGYATVAQAAAVTGTNVQTGNYTLALSDAGGAVEQNSASATTVTVPPNSSVAFPVGTVIEVAQIGAGQVTIAAGSGVTVQNSSSATTRAQYSTVSLRKRATDIWLLAGDVT